MKLPRTFLTLKRRPERVNGFSRLKAKTGEMTMENELLRERARRLEANLPLDVRRPKR
jgi:hypothetical protein